MMERDSAESRRTITTSTPITRTTETGQLWLLLIVGLAIQIAGFVTAFGGDILVMLGLFVFGLGSVLSLIAVIGFGVLLGIRAHERS